jgi:hypothetical protein
VSDIVTWNNTTNQEHWLWPVDANGNPLPDNQISTQFGNYLSDKIPGMSSTRYYDGMMPASGSTINYCCKLHPKMRGQINVNPIPPPLQTWRSHPLPRPHRPVCGV